MRAAALLIVSVGTLGFASPLKAQIPWQTNLKVAHDQAKAEGKLLLLHFYSDNCVYCDRLEAGAFQSPDVAQSITEHYVPVKVHAGKSPTLANTFRVTRWPTDVIVTTDGSVLSHGVSPQAPAAYRALLAQHSAAASSGGSELAAQRAPSNSSQPTAAPQQPPASQAPAAAGLSLAQQPQTNPYAPPTDATAHAQVMTPAAPTVNTADPAPSRAGFALPPDFGGIRARPAGHRQPGLDLAPPEQSTIETNPLVGRPDGLSSADVPGHSATAAAIAEADSAQPQPPLAIDGYCPVSVVDHDTWTAGDPSLGVIHLGQLYLFANAGAMEKFLADPVAYTPVMNGIDVVRFFEERRVVPGSREWGLKDPEFNRMFFFADEASMNHFFNAYQRYTRSAIEVTRQAAGEANGLR